VIAELPAVSRRVKYVATLNSIPVSKSISGENSKGDDADDGDDSMTRARRDVDDVDAIFDNGRPSDAQLISVEGSLVDNESQVRAICHQQVKQCL
jgi:hypothetical protein